MDIGREIVTRILSAGEIQPYLDAGFTLDWLHDREDPSPQAVFGDGQQEYAWLLAQYQRHGKPASLERFRENFPAWQHGRGGNCDTELIDEAIRRVRKAQLEVLAGTLGDLVPGADEDVDDETVRACLDAFRLRTARHAAPVFRFRALGGHELDALPDPEPLLGTVMAEGKVGILSGPFGSGKSFLALDWACCVASGTAWQGHAARQRHAVYVAAEGASGQKRRLKAWERERGASTRGSLTFVIDAVQFAEPADVRDLCALVRHTEAGLVVIDTQARTTVGLEENSATDMGHFTDALFRIRDAVAEEHTTVLVLHHTGWGDRKRARGSTAVPAGVDFIYNISTDGDPCELMELTCDKQKDGERLEDVALRLRPVVLPYGSSCVVEGSDPGDHEDPDQSSDRIITSLIRDDPGIRKPDLVRQAMLAGISQATAYRSLKRLIGVGKIRMETGKRLFLTSTDTSQS